MNALVVAPNLLQLFIGWELVGVTSYLLIGFYFRKPSAAHAAVKAFWVTKFADMGFLFGLLALYVATGSFAWDAHLAPETATLVTLLFFLAVVGKIGAVPAPRLAPRRDGRAHARLRAPPRGDDGRRGRLSGRAGQPALRAVGDDTRPHAGARRRYRVLRGASRPGADRHQEGPRLLDLLPARLHDRGARRGLPPRRFLPSHHARLLQGAPLPGGRKRNPCRALERDRRHGGAGEENAANRGGVPRRRVLARRDPRLLWVLQQGPRARRGRGEARLGAVGRSPCDGVSHRLLHGEGRLRGVLRRAVGREREARARAGVVDARAARRSGGTVDRGRVLRGPLRAAARRGVPLRARTRARPRRGARDRRVRGGLSRLRARKARSRALRDGVGRAPRPHAPRQSHLRGRLPACHARPGRRARVGQSLRRRRRDQHARLLDARGRRPGAPNPDRSPVGLRRSGRPRAVCFAAWAVVR